MELNPVATTATNTTANIVSSSVSTVSLQLQKPKKILHFSDGTLEEYSDDDDETDGINHSNLTTTSPAAVVDEKELPWGPWIIHKSYQAGSTVLAGCDYAGEVLAGFLGITQSKYASEIEEYKKSLNEQQELEKQEKELAPWHETKELNPNQVITSDLHKTINRF